MVLRQTLKRKACSYSCGIPSCQQECKGVQWHNQHFPFFLFFMYWVIWVQPPLGFEPGSSALEADDLPTELSLPQPALLTVRDVFSNNRWMDHIYCIFHIQVLNKHNKIYTGRNKKQLQIYELKKVTKKAKNKHWKGVFKMSLMSMEFWCIFLLETKLALL